MSTNKYSNLCPHTWCIKFKLLTAAFLAVISMEMSLLTCNWGTQPCSISLPLPVLSPANFCHLLEEGNKMRVLSYICAFSDFRHEVIWSFAVLTKITKFVEFLWSFKLFHPQFSNAVLILPQTPEALCPSETPPRSTFVGFPDKFFSALQPAEKNCSVPDQWCISPRLKQKSPLQESCAFPWIVNSLPSVLFIALCEVFPLLFPFPKAVRQ